MLMMMVVATQSATAASSWLAMPNIGQMGEIEPDQMKAAHPATTSAVVMSAPCEFPEVVRDGLPTGDERRRGDEGERHNRRPTVTRAAHVDDDGRRHAERDRSQELVGDAEHRADGRD